MPNGPDDLRYSKDHLWARLDPDTSDPATVSQQLASLLDVGAYRELGGQ